MKLGSILSAVVGIGLAAFLLSRSGIASVATVLERASFGIVLVICFHAIQLLCSAVAWRAIADERDRPRAPIRSYLLLRWLREGIDNLLPVAQVGGEFVAARLLKRDGLRLAEAAAGVICDVTVETVTQAGYVLCGLALLLTANRAGVAGVDHGVTRAALLAAAGGAVAVCLFLSAQWLGLGRLLEFLLFRLSHRFGGNGAADVSGLQEALLRLWRRPGAVGRAVACHAVSWLLGGPEVWIALHALGAERSMLAAIVIESLGGAIKAAGFAIPGAIGVQEGGFVLVCGLYGIHADTAIALSLVKRLRELVLGAPSLLVWQWLERDRRDRDDHQVAPEGRRIDAATVDMSDAA